ncbi:glycoside hydrolase family 97 protein [Sinomicrobium sp.]
MFQLRSQIKVLLCLGGTSLLFYACGTKTENLLFISPDATVRVEIALDSTGYYRLNVSKKDFAFVENGKLGLSLQGQDSLFTSLVETKGPFDKAEVVDEMGISGPVERHWNEYILEFSQGEQITLRVFDEGIAYRYVFDSGQATSHVLGEESSWGIPAQTKVWFFERDNDWKLKSYAGEWQWTTIEQLRTVSETGNIQGKPLVFEYQNGTYGLLAEAGLFNYSGMRFEALPGNRIKANFSEGDKGFIVKGTVLSPWRVAFVADGLNQLIHQQTIITSLNPEPDAALFADRSWIKPGRSVWSWWSNFTGTPELQKQMVDYAKELGFEHNLIDANWEKWPDKWTALKEVCRYGKENEVITWVWKHSDELNFSENDYQMMQAFMDSLKVSGVGGIKVDFMDGERKSLIDFDEAVLRHAAERKLMVNFHGVQTATGEIKRYPNELTREGIRGLELNTHPEGPITASHNAALPFTRFILGHGDYTPLTFTATGETTWAHQLATLVLFTSPVQIIAENPEILLKHPAVKDALPLIKQIPTVWDETVVLPGSKIGELAVIARRKDHDWYIGVLNGGEKKTVEIDLTLLNTAVGEAVLYRDATERIANPISREYNAKDRHYSAVITPFVMEKKQISGNKITINIEKNGGAVLLVRR